MSALLSLRHRVHLNFSLLTYKNLRALFFILFLSLHKMEENNRRAYIMRLPLNNAPCALAKCNGSFQVSSRRLFIYAAFELQSPLFRYLRIIIENDRMAVQRIKKSRRSTFKDLYLNSYKMLLALLKLQQFSRKNAAIYGAREKKMDNCKVSFVLRKNEGIFIKISFLQPAHHCNFDDGSTFPGNNFWGFWTNFLYEWDL